MSMETSSIYLESVYQVVYPLIRLIVAGFIVYYLSDVSAYVLLGRRDIIVLTRAQLILLCLMISENRDYVRES